jgi:hypothetical protein
LGDTLKRSENFDDTKEHFNAEAVRNIISRSKAMPLPEYYDYLKTVRQSNGLFGLQVAHQHTAKLIKKCYAGDLDDADSWFCLGREGFCSPGIHLYRAAHAAGVSHS